MGNNCVNGRFIHAISCSIWGRPSKERLDYDSKEVSSILPSESKEQESSTSVQNKPPELVIIVKEGNLPSKSSNPEIFIKVVKEEEQSSRSKNWESVVREKGVDTKPTLATRSGHGMMNDRNDTKQSQALRPDNSIKNERDDTKSAVVERPNQVVGKPNAVEAPRPSVGKPKPVEAPRAKMPHNVKRMASAGLQVDSVLRTKTAHLKEYYNLGNKLGNGQFGTTFLCVERATGKQYACKSIAKRKLLSQDDVDDVKREVEIMHHLAGSANIISIKDAYEDSVAVHVVMQLCTGGELFDRIVKRGHYSERKAAQLARTIVGVIQTCHSLGVMHRDLKPENFLFVNQEEDSPVIAIDFGLSSFFKPGQIFTDVVGSPYYVAPEVLMKRYGPEADIWSAGVIIYILLSGVPPFWGESEQEIFKEVLQGRLDFSSDPWPHISESAKDLVRRMLVRDPKKRITAHEVLCHPWVRVDGVAPDKPLDSAVLTRLTKFSAMNKFKKMALRVIAESLSEEEIAGLREMFKTIDADNSGQITFDELKEGLKKYGANLNESEIYDLMRAADVDNNGTIDYGEFIAATLHLNKIEKEDHLYAAFSYFDKDNSGYITLDELQKACDDFGIRESQLEAMIREADQNNDGQIDYNEFVAMMHKEMSDMGSKPLRNRMNFGFRETMQYRIEHQSTDAGKMQLVTQ